MNDMKHFLIFIGCVSFGLFVFVISMAAAMRVAALLLDI